MSTFLGGAGGRGGHSSGNSSLAEDVGASVFSAAPFGRSTPAVGGASGSGSWRSTHSDASAQTSAVKSAVEGGVRPKKGGKKGEVNEESKADKLLGEAALKDGEEGDLSTEIMRLYEVRILLCRPAEEDVQLTTPASSCNAPLRPPLPHGSTS